MVKRELILLLSRVVRQFLERKGKKTRMNERCSQNQKMDSSDRLFFGGEVRICFSCPVFLNLTLYLQRKKSKRESVLYLSTIAFEMNEEKQKKLLFLMFLWGVMIIMQPLCISVIGAR